MELGDGREIGKKEGGMETEIAKRVGAGWMNWKKCSGVLCDKRMPV